MAHLKNAVRATALVLLLFASAPPKQSEAIPYIDGCWLGCTIAAAVECMPKYEDVVACAIYEAACIASCKAFS